MENENKDLNQENKDVQKVEPSIDNKSQDNLKKVCKKGICKKFFKKCCKFRWIFLIILAFIVAGSAVFAIGREYDRDREGKREGKSEKREFREGKSEGKSEKGENYKGENYKGENHKGEGRDEHSGKDEKDLDKKDREEGQNSDNFDSNLLISNAKITAEDAIKAARVVYPDCKISEVGVGNLNGNIIFHISAVDKDGSFIQLQIDASDAKILKTVIDSENK